MDAINSVQFSNHAGILFKNVGKLLSQWFTTFLSYDTSGELTHLLDFMLPYPVRSHFSSKEIRLWTQK